MYPDFKIFFVFVFFSWSVIFLNAMGRLKKWLVHVKVIKKCQYYPLDHISFCFFFYNEGKNSEKSPSLPYKSGEESITMNVVGFKK